MLDLKDNFSFTIPIALCLLFKGKSDDATTTLTQGVSPANNGEQAQGLWSLLFISA